MENLNQASDTSDNGTASDVNSRQSQNQITTRLRSRINAITTQRQQTVDESVSVCTTQPTTSLTRQRQRTMWTNEMNKFIIRCYFKITKLEQQSIPYSSALHEEVTNRFPELENKTVQNILDQKRSILLNNRIAHKEMEEIKREVSIELGLISESREEENLENIPSETLHESQHIIDLFEELYIKYAGIRPNLRPGIPKLKKLENNNEIIRSVSEIMQIKYKENQSLQHIHALIYTGAATIITLNNQKLIEKQRENRPDMDVPPWKRRLENRVKMLRKEIGILTQATRSSPSNRVIRISILIVLKYKNDQNKTEVEILDLLKQRLAVFANRIRRYTRSQKRRYENNLFRSSEKKFYRYLEKNGEPTPATEQACTPTKDEIEQYWSNMWSNGADYKHNAAWIEKEKHVVRNCRPMDNNTITVEEVKKAVTKTQNWKAPGPDGIHNYWYKKFVLMHKEIAKQLTEIVQQPEKMPIFLCEGITYLIPKTIPCNNDPSKYRPITCLPTLYKILTSILADKVYEYLHDNNILAIEQKGCCRGSRGCKEQLVIDSTIMGQVSSTKKNIHTAYIDYQKAYDSVPHTWLIKVLRIYKIDTVLIQFLERVMGLWQTKIKLNSNLNILETSQIKINRGIFQGDSLSGLWFCIALNPLSTILNSTNVDYPLNTNGINLNHLLYMDDIKLYATDRVGIDRLLKTTKQFSSDISMNFGLDKCRLCTITKGKLDSVMEPYYTDLESNECITNMQDGEFYKYLGYQQAKGIDHSTSKSELTGRYVNRINKILKTELNSRNKIKAVNTFAIPVLTYSFGILKWTVTELNNLNRLTRVLFTKHRCHHPKSAIERFNLPRNKGGRGVGDITMLHHNQVEQLREYFHNKSEALHSAISNMDVRLTPLNLSQRTIPDPCIRNNSENSIIERWKQKAIHGKYPNILEEVNIDEVASCSWLTDGDLFSETEGFMIAIQDGVIATRNYRKYIIKDDTVSDDKCRMCQQYAENTDHIISGCTLLAPTLYTKRHNNVAKIVYRDICKGLNLSLEQVPYYKYQPQPVLENDTCKIYWDRSIITDHTIIHNRPDITLTDKTKRITYLIDITIPVAYNIQKRYSEKITKYLPLAQEIKQLWNQESVTIIPIVIGAQGEIPKSLHKSLKALNLNKNLHKELQKAVIIETTGIVRTVIGSSQIV